MRGRSQCRSKLKSRYGNRSLTHGQCIFCKQTGLWKKDCPKLKKKNKLKKKLEKSSEMNIAKSDGSESDSSTFSLSITS